MFKSFKFPVSAALASFLFCFGCNEQKPANEKITEVIATPGTNTNNTDTAVNPFAESPSIIRSAVPEGYYGHEPDTFQISQYIRVIFQDRKGDLWFGTVGDGVCQYDGVSLIYHTTREGVSGNTVQGIAEDASGNIWFGTDGGVTKYDGQKFLNYSEAAGLPKKHVASLFIDKRNNIWVGTAGGICFYNSQNPVSDGKMFSAFSIPESDEKREVKKISEDQNGKIWFATNGGGIYSYDGSNLKHIAEKDGLSNNVVNSLLQDRSGIFWFATAKGLSRYDQLSEMTSGARAITSYKDEKGSNEIWRVYEDKKGYVWVAQRGGVRRYDPKQMIRSAGKSFLNFTAADGLKNMGVQSILEDRAGNIWFGTGAGLYRLNEERLLHPCYLKTCQHDLNQSEDQFAHQDELGKTFVNVGKTGPWLKRFR